jgi:hypothetical protein
MLAELLDKLGLTGFEAVDQLIEGQFGLFQKLIAILLKS